MIPLLVPEMEGGYPERDGGEEEEEGQGWGNSRSLGFHINISYGGFHPRS